MTRVRLADLGQGLGRGPSIVTGALFGATVAVATSWLKGSRAGFLGDAVLGASVGTVVSLVGYAAGSFISEREHEHLSEAPTSPALAEASVRTGLAPFPFYRPSLSYPWSEH